MSRPRTICTLLLAGTALLTSCGEGSGGGPASQEQTLTVAASFYPLEWIATRLGGDGVSVTGLTPAGTEPHDLVLGPAQRRAVEQSGVVLYLGSSFQPDVERAVRQREGGTGAVDLLRSPGLELLPAPDDLGKESLDGDDDPHVWLDPDRMAIMAEQAADALVEGRPELADPVAVRLAVLRSDLAGLGTRIGAALKDCRQRTIVTSHAAFGYLADRYDLEQVAIAGLSPDAEPDPAALRDVAERASAAQVATVFFEEALPPDLAETVAREIGAATDLLGALEFDPAQVVGPQEDYLTVMQRNGDALARGLGCAP